MQILTTLVYDCLIVTTYEKMHKTYSGVCLFSKN